MIEIPNIAGKTNAEIWTELATRAQEAQHRTAQLDFEVQHTIGRRANSGAMTSSYEQAARFLQEELPGWSYRLQYHADHVDGHKHVFTLMAPLPYPEGSITDDGSWSRHYDGRGHTEALAMISAFCQMKAATVEIV